MVLDVTFANICLRISVCCGQHEIDIKYSTRNSRLNHLIGKKIKYIYLDIMFSKVRSHYILIFWMKTAVWCQLKLRALHYGSFVELQLFSSRISSCRCMICCFRVTALLQLGSYEWGNDYNAQVWVTFHWQSAAFWFLPISTITCSTSSTSWLTS